MSTKITCVIVDDEPIATSIIEQYLENYPTLELVRSFSSALEALPFLSQNSIDILFLDINMPQLSGMEMLHTLKKRPLIIITTAHHRYAVESFEQNVTDYLIKPFSFQRFVSAINRCLDKLTITDPNTEKDKTIVIKDRKILHNVSYNDIVFIESLGDYVKFHLKNGSLTTLQTIKLLEETLPSNKFMRVHKSYIVGVNYIRTFHGNILEVREEKIPIGESHRKEVRAYLETKTPKRHSSRSQN